MLVNVDVVMLTALGFFVLLLICLTAEALYFLQPFI
jgi:hypothetical protein